jgi:glycosyltransferase involved in cell wall biosynthesis
LPYVTGVALEIAAQAGVPVRIAHSHNDHTRDEAGASWLRQLYVQTMKRRIARYATAGFACSARAACSMFGADWAKDERFRVLYYGVDFAPFRQAADLTARAELGLPAEAFVLGHVGRFVEQKNHMFLLEIAAEVARRLPDMHLLLLGEGPMRDSIRAHVERLGLTDRIVFAGGDRPDVPRLMQSVMDVFVLPSLFEGLGLVLVEAQAAGLPCVISDVVPKEADILPLHVCRLPLAESASVWADAILRVHQETSGIPPEDALQQAEASDFNLCRSVQSLESIYDNQ